MADVFTVAATNLVKDSAKAKPAKGSSEDTGYFYQVGDSVDGEKLANVDALLASGAITASGKKPAAPAEKDEA